jgi:hypothetical protein
MTIELEPGQSSTEEMEDNATMPEVPPENYDESQRVSPDINAECQFTDMRAMLELFKVKAEIEVAPFLLPFKEQQFNIQMLEELGTLFS